MSQNHSIEIPEFYLLTIAVYGNMGDGELPDLMSTWARRLCKELSLDDELRKLQEERRLELRRRLQNVLGKDAVEEIETTIDQVTRKLTS